MDAMKIRGNLPAMVLPLGGLRLADVSTVGGKNASLGELIVELSQLGLRVPNGFATTTDAYRQFLSQDGLAERIARELAGLDVENLEQLTRTGALIRGWIMATPLPIQLVEEISTAWQAMSSQHPTELSLAVRSSATAEDLPEASFAGQQETFLNIRGLPALLKAVQQVFSSSITIGP